MKKSLFAVREFVKKKQERGKKERKKEKVAELLDLETTIVNLRIVAENQLLFKLLRRRGLFGGWNEIFWTLTGLSDHIESEICSCGASASLKFRFNPLNWPQSTVKLEFAVVVVFFPNSRL